MKISDLFGRTGVYGNRRIGSDAKNDEQDSGRQIQKDPSGDRTTISEKALILSQVSKVREELDGEREKRIADIKRRVDAGEYAVSSRDVAGRIVEFLGERV